VLSLVLLRYVDEANLSPAWRWVARSGVPLAAVLMPAAFFLSVLSSEATEPNALIYLAFVGAACIVTAILTLGIGLLRVPRGGIAWRSCARPAEERWCTRIGPVRRLANSCRLPA
jgi:hypothetical protein